MFGSSLFSSRSSPPHRKVLSPLLKNQIPVRSEKLSQEKSSVSSSLLNINIQVPNDGLSREKSCASITLSISSFKDLDVIRNLHKDDESDESVWFCVKVVRIEDYEFVLKYPNPNPNSTDERTRDIHEMLNNEKRTLSELSKNLKNGKTLASFSIMPCYNVMSSDPIIAMPYDDSFSELYECLSENFFNKQEEEITIEFFLKVLTQVVREGIRAINYIAECNIIHNDIKQDNILLCYANGNIQMRVIDFGNSLLCPNQTVQLSYQGAIQPPESNFDIAVKNKTDLWCFAATIMPLMLDVYRVNQSEISVILSDKKLGVYGSDGWRYIAAALEVLKEKQDTDSYIMAFLRHGLKTDPTDRSFCMLDNGANQVLSEYSCAKSGI